MVISDLNLHRKDNKRSLSGKDSAADFCGLGVEFLYKLYLAVPRAAWRWADVEKIAKEIEIWGDETDVCLYVSPLLRKDEEFFFLPILDFDCGEDPVAACQAAAKFLFSFPSREGWQIFLSGKKGVKLTGPCFPFDLARSFRRWISEKVRRIKLQEYIDFSTLPSRQDIATPPQPVRLFGWRGKENGGDYVAARPVSFQQLLKIKKKEDYTSLVCRRPSGKKIAGWTRDFASCLVFAPAWLLDEIKKHKKHEKQPEKEDKYANRKKSLKFDEIFRLDAENPPEDLEILQVKQYGKKKIYVLAKCPFCGGERKKAFWMAGRIFCKRASCQAWEKRGGLAYGKKKGEQVNINIKVEEIEKIRKKNFEKIEYFYNSDNDVLFLASGTGTGKTYAVLRGLVPKCLLHDELIVFATTNKKLTKEITKSVGIEALPAKEDVCFSKRYLNKMRDKGYSDNVICKRCEHHPRNASKAKVEACKWWVDLEKKIKEGLIICHHNAVNGVIYAANILKSNIDYVVIDEAHKLIKTDKIKLKEIIKDIAVFNFDSALKLTDKLREYFNLKPDSKTGYFVPVKEEIENLMFNFIYDYIFYYVNDDSELIDLFFKQNIDTFLAKAEEKLFDSELNAEEKPDFKTIKRLYSIIKGNATIVITKNKKEIIWNNTQKIEKENKNGKEIKRVYLSATIAPCAIKLLEKKIKDNQIYAAFPLPRGKLYHVATGVSKRTIESQNAKYKKVKAIAKAITQRDEDRIITYKNASENEDVYFYKTEGTNIFKNEDSLIVIGNPILSPADLIANSLVLFKDEKERKEYLIWQQVDELLQSFGRLRKFFTNKKTKIVFADHLPHILYQFGFIPAIKIPFFHSEKYNDVTINALKRLNKITKEEALRLAFEVVKGLRNVNLDALISAIKVMSKAEIFWLIAREEALKSLSAKERDRLLKEIELRNKNLQFIHKRKGISQYLVYFETEEIKKTYNTVIEEKIETEEELCQLLANPPPREDKEEVYHG